MDYFIKLGNQEIMVTREVYKEYCRGQRKERYFREGDIRNHTFSYDALDTDDMRGEALFADKEGGVEQQVEEHMMGEALAKALKELDDEETELIERLYVYEQSLRQVAAQKKLAVSTLHYRHKKILQKIRSRMS